MCIRDRINLGVDIKDYRKLPAPERRAYDKILSFLIFLDSLQSANLPAVGEYITANEVNLCLAIQTFQETVHSQSYSYMLDTICEPQERNDVLYQWKEDEHLLARNEFIGNLYNQFQDDKSPEALARVLVDVYKRQADKGLRYRREPCGPRNDRGRPGGRPHREEGGRGRGPAFVGRSLALRRSRARRWSCPWRKLRRPAGRTSRSGRG